MPAERGFAEVNGTRLWWELAGQGPPLVLIHGFTLDHRIWEDQMATLTDRYRLLRYDLRGFGKSDPPTPLVPYTHAGDLRALLDHLGIERAAVLGLSLGGWVALEFTLTYPAAVDALILLDAALREFPYTPEVNDSIGELYRLGREGTRDEMLSHWLANPIFTVTHEEPSNARRLVEIVSGYSGCHFQFDDSHPPMSPPAISRLAEVSARTLVLVGERDLPDFHRIADLLATNIPDARKSILPGAGHMACLETPAPFNQAILAFLD